MLIDIVYHNRHSNAWRVSKGVEQPAMERRDADEYEGGWGRQGTNASKIRNEGPLIDRFLIIKEGDLTQRDSKRKLFLWRLGCIAGRPQICLGCSEYTKATRSHLVRCSGIEAAMKILCKRPEGHQQLEQGTHI